MILTIPAYAKKASFTSGAGFDRPSYVQGARAPILTGAFFVPGGFSFGFAHGETSGSAGFLERRSVNPVCVATILIDSESWRLINNQFKGLVMPHSLFVVRDNVAPDSKALIRPLLTCTAIIVRLLILMSITGWAGSCGHSSR